MTLVLRKLLASSTFAIAGALDIHLERGCKAKLDEADANRTARRGTRRGLRGARRDGRGMGRRRRRRAAVREPTAPPSKQEIADLDELRQLATSIDAQRQGQGAAEGARRSPSPRRSELGAAQKGDHLHRIPATQSYLLRAAGRQPVCATASCSSTAPIPTSGSKAIYAAWLERHQGTDRVTGSQTADMRSALVDYFREEGQHHDRHRGRRRGHQPPVLLAGRELRPAVESAAHRAAHRPLPPLRPEARRGGRQLPEPQERGRPARLSSCSSEKFQLFEGVFGASDEVLGAIESGVDFEKRIADIYQHAASTRRSRPRSISSSSN